MKITASCKKAVIFLIWILIRLREDVKEHSACMASDVWKGLKLKSEFIGIKTDSPVIIQSVNGDKLAYGNSDMRERGPYKFDNQAPYPFWLHIFQDSKVSDIDGGVCRLSAEYVGVFTG